jgi:AcrR family transcriptional regulator
VGRPAKFDSDRILDAAALIVAEGGPSQTTVAGIAERLGAPSGSIYHRFESKDLLLARLWIRTVQRAQEGFITALSVARLEEAALDAALHIPRWSRRHLSDASVLLLYRREDLAERWPDELGDELSALNQGMERAIREFTHRWFGQVTAADLQRVTFSLIDVPYAACRRYLLGGKPPPPVVDELIAQTCKCTLQIAA